MAIKQLKDRIEQVSAMIAEQESRLHNNPDSSGIKIELSSLKNHLNDLYAQLKKANTNRHKEVLELRLIGKPASFGTLPLDIAGALTSAFSNAMLNTSKFLQFGSKKSNVKQIVRETIDLRLEAIGSGSTIFYLSGRTSPDMYGNSLIQDSLNSMFSLFNSDEGDEFVENLAKVGVKSIKHYSKFFKELNEENLELEMTWSTPEDDIQKWYGNKARIISFYNTLNKIQTSPPSTIDFVGKLISSSLKGRFEIETLEGRTIRGTFPNDLLGKVKELRIGDNCKGVITEQKIFNPNTNNHRFEYSLVFIDCNQA